MSFKSLKDRLSQKPKLLAGPILRKVTEDSVSVWLAFSQRATVKMKILDSADAVVFDEGKRDTIAVGEKLHFAVVTAQRKGSESKLVPGVIYQYHLTFDFGANLSTTLKGAAGDAELTYAPYTNPTFCLPPNDATRLRLMHGSCRMPHGQGFDALNHLHLLIRDTAKNADLRPQQLILSGDQIYADDVALSLMMMLSDASDVLLGWTEKLPVVGPYSVPPLPPPWQRSFHIREANFTTVDYRAHLMSLGEYLCMYLFAWSDVLWDAADLPSFADIKALIPPAEGGSRDPGHEWQADIKEASVTVENGYLKNFRKTLPNVRRALANIPSYMIFDDHEVTDDWNMTFKQWSDIYADNLGMRICQNALAAYNLCQHWGNVPEDFLDSNSSLPGTKILTLMNGLNANQYEQRSNEIRKAVGLYDGATFKSKRAAGHEPGTIKYNYTIEGPRHQIIVADSRSWRVFPGQIPVLIPEAQIQEQIVKTPPTGDRLLFIVLSTNAPSIRSIRTATELDWVANYFEHFPDVYESWEMSTPAIDHLFKAMSEKMPPVAGGHKGHAIILSGDIHMSFASRMLFKATRRIDDPVSSPKSVEAVIAQLVCSGCKRQNADTVKFDREGYNRDKFVEKRTVPKRHPEGYAGWNVVPNSNTWVADDDDDDPVRLNASRSVECNADGLMKYRRVPDWGYRLDYLLPVGEATSPVGIFNVPATTSATTDADRKKSADAYNKAAGNYRIYSNKTPKQIVGLNSLSEVTFDRLPSGGLEVNHTMRWRTKDGTESFFTTYAVSLEFDPVADLADFNAVQPHP
jgi:hypothetical protein